MSQRVIFFQPQTAKKNPGARLGNDSVSLWKMTSWSMTKNTLFIIIYYSIIHVSVRQQDDTSINIIIEMYIIKLL